MTVTKSGESAEKNRFQSRNVSIAPPASSSSQGEVIGTPSTYVLPTNQKRSWTKRDERRFLELAKKSALGTVTPEEASKLAQMERIRYSLNSNRSYREILAEKRRFEKADKLIHALNDYLETTH